MFKKKFKSDNIVNWYKARLVAKGYLQQLGVDYGKMYSPVIKPSIVCVVFALAASHNWSVWQLDINNEFLNGVLQLARDHLHGST